MKGIINKLFVQKLAIAFVVGFLGSLLTTVTGWGDSPDFSFNKAALISLVVAGFTAGFRAVLALSPINLTPSDKQHSLTNLKKNDGQISVLLLVILIVLILVVAGGVFISHVLLWLLILVVLLAVIFGLSGRGGL